MALPLGKFAILVGAGFIGSVLANEGGASGSLVLSRYCYYHEATGFETTLFWYQFKLQMPEAQKVLLREFNLPYKAVTSAEFESVKEKLDQITRSIGTPLSPADSIFYKVPFEEVPELVAERKVYISRGNAHVAMNQIVEALSISYVGPDYSQTRESMEVLHQLNHTSFAFGFMLAN